MKTRSTLLLAFLAAAFFSYLWFVERHLETTRDAAESSARVVSIERDKVDSLAIRNGASQIELRKKDGVWLMEQPVQDRADPSALDRLLGLLEGLRHDAKIDLPKGREQEMLTEFGLVDSETTLKLKAGSGKELELLLGKDSAVEGKIYIRQQGKNSAFVIRNELRGRVTAPADEYRDHKLTATPVSAVQKFTIKSNDGEIELERKSGQWDLVRPIRARAASSKVNDLLAGALTAQIARFLPEYPSPEQGLAEPRARLTASVDGEKEPLVLEVGASPNGGENQERSFAKISGRAAVTVLPNTALDPLFNARPNDLRDRKLVRVEPDIVDRITFERPGESPLVLMRKGEGWNYRENEKDMPVREGLAGKILADLLAAEAVHFVADLATDPAQYGLAAPRLRVRLSSFASENTVESKAGESPIVTLLFGGVEGEICHVKLEDEPFIVASEKKLLESLPADTFDLLPSAPSQVLWELNPPEVDGIELSAKDGPPVQLNKQDGRWTTAAEGLKPDTAAIEALLARITALHAGRRTERHPTLIASLATPTLTLKISTQTNGAQAHQTLAVGSRLKDGTFPATLSGKDGFFLLSAEDAAALQKRLVE